MLLVIGGGAAGFFAALAAKGANPHAQVVLLEKSAVLLAKVRVSGGGRCNVTHNCFDPKLLTQNYPRGNRELLGPFHRFQPRDTIAWFEARGVELKTEKDGRMFPITDSSQTIIDCLTREAHELGVEIRLKQKIEKIEKCPGGFQVFLADQEPLFATALVLATGSGKEGHAWAHALGHTIVEPVPSLFTFNIPNSPLAHLSGIAVDPVTVTLPEAKLSQTGPLLITHFGLSGPAVLKLSAWAARELHAANYHAPVKLNWLTGHKEDELFETLRAAKQSHPQQTLAGANPWRLPKNLWNTLIGQLAEHRLSTLADKQLRGLAHHLQNDTYTIEGKTTHKEEFVTCGGIALPEVDFKTLQSKICPGLYFAGEILDIDGVTGGFNFQNAWTTGYLAGTHAANNDT
jgi:predicted Rossmann fold flavoprotein